MQLKAQRPPSASPLLLLQALVPLPKEAQDSLFFPVSQG